MISYIIPIVVLLVLILLVIYSIRFLNDQSPRNESIKDQLRILKFLLIPIFLIAIICYFYSVFTFFAFKNFIGVFSILLAVCSGTVLIGALLGFLFGIPKSSTNPNTSNEENSEEKTEINNDNELRSNTNLEEISDWLTKIILGASLVEIGNILNFFWSISNKIAYEIYNHAFLVVGLIASSGVCGFFLGYLLTRLFLVGAFNREMLNRFQNKIEGDVIDTIGEVAKLDPKEYLEKRINNNQKAILKELKENGRKKLKSDFLRESQDYEDLKELRNLKIIRPSEGGKMESGKTIVPTRLGNIILNNWSPD